eukprot:4078038-Amphidinium_carterae.1
MKQSGAERMQQPTNCVACCICAESGLSLQWCVRWHAVKMSQTLCKQQLRTSPTPIPSLCLPRGITLLQPCSLQGVGLMRLGPSEQKHVQKQPPGLGLYFEITYTPSVPYEY